MIYICEYRKYKLSLYCQQRRTRRITDLMKQKSVNMSFQTFTPEQAVKHLSSYNENVGREKSKKEILLRFDVYDFTSFKEVLRKEKKYYCCHVSYFDRHNSNHKANICLKHGKILSITPYSHNGNSIGTTRIEVSSFEDFENKIYEALKFN